MDYNRFKKTFVWVAANSYKSAIFGAIWLTCALIAFYCIMGGIDTTIYMGETWEQTQMKEMWGATMFVLLMVMVWGMSGITKDMRNNDGRVMILMLPASNLEKYLARFLWLELSWAAICMVSVICADIVRIILSYIIGWQLHGSMLVSVISNGNFLPSLFYSSEPVLNVFWLIFILISTQGFYALGGTFFRRHPLILTIATSYALSTLLGIIVAIIFMGLPESAIMNIAEWFFNLFNSDSNWQVLIIIVPFVLLTALTYWASFKLYCRTQVISNKWINL